MPFMRERTSRADEGGSSPSSSVRSAISSPGDGTPSPPRWREMRTQALHPEEVKKTLSTLSRNRERMEAIFRTYGDDGNDMVSVDHFNSVMSVATGVDVTKSPIAEMTDSHTRDGRVNFVEFLRSCSLGHDTAATSSPSSPSSTLREGLSRTEPAPVDLSTHTQKDYGLKKMRDGVFVTSKGTLARDERQLPLSETVPTLQRHIGDIMDDELGVGEPEEHSRWSGCLNRLTRCAARTPTPAKIIVILLVGTVVGFFAMHAAAPAAVAGVAGKAAAGVAGKAAAGVAGKAAAGVAGKAAATAAGHAAGGVTALEVESLIFGHAVGDLVTHGMFEEAKEMFEHMEEEAKKKLLLYVLGKIMSFLLKQQLNPLKFEGKHAAADMIEAILRCKPLNLEIDRVRSFGDLLGPVLGLNTSGLETWAPKADTARGGGYIKRNKTKRNRNKTKRNRNKTKRNRKKTKRNRKKTKSILKYKN